jgi:hypothetical protein
MRIAIAKDGARLLLLVAGTCGFLATARAQQAPQKPAPQKPAAIKPAARVYYDIYEPLQRRRLRKEACLKDEDSVGANCVKKCMPSYELKAEFRPMRCQGTKPLPPGMLPGPIRSDVGVQPMPEPPEKPQPVKPGGA